MSSPYKILFLCTGNSARSIMAEYILRRMEPNRFLTYSAGAQPSGRVNPLAIQVLEKNFNINAADARSKSWEEFRDVDFDFVFTLCDNAKESCPTWPGRPIVNHWRFDDPASFTGTEQEKFHATSKVAMQIRNRLSLFTLLPIDKLERMSLKNAVADIARQEPQSKSL